jgi:hypothetical protein
MSQEVKDAPGSFPIGHALPRQCLRRHGGYACGRSGGGKHRDTPWRHLAIQYNCSKVAQESCPRVRPDTMSGPSPSHKRGPRVRGNVRSVCVGTHGLRAQLATLGALASCAACCPTTVRDPAQAGPHRGKFAQGVPSPLSPGHLARLPVDYLLATWRKSSAIKGTAPVGLQTETSAVPTGQRCPGKGALGTCS